VGAQGDEARAVVERLEDKTRELLDKFGPGPRVHYHTGLYRGAVDEAWTLDELRGRMVEAQERLLEHAAEGWDGRAGCLGRCWTSAVAWGEARSSGPSGSGRG